MSHFWIGLRQVFFFFFSFFFSYNPVSLSHSFFFSSESSDMKLYGYLSKYFNMTVFRDGQLLALRQLEKKRDSIVVLPMGAGKSLIHQLFSLSRPGIGVVFVPIDALKRNQVKNLIGTGIHAALLGGKNPTPRDEILSGKFKIVYLCPEWLFQKEGENLTWNKTNLKFLEDLDLNIGINLITFDEAHLLSEWSNFFFPPFFFHSPFF